ncbi:MAG: cation:dicarboxylase symporter family transporter [Acidobacteria bacterium]|nr:cation:dicarboxylase symporter family transporter [Acidobacteriota bacterium]
MIEIKPNEKAWYFKLHWQVLIALLAGVAMGWILPAAAQAIGFLGDLFLRLLKMIIIPLVFTSLVSSPAHVGARRRSENPGQEAEKGDNKYHLPTRLLGLRYKLIA